MGNVSFHMQDAMRLTTAQLKRMLELRVGFLAKMDLLLKQRKDIVWELQQTTILADTAVKRDEVFGKVTLVLFAVKQALALSGQDDCWHAWLPTLGEYLDCDPFHMIQGLLYLTLMMK